MQGKKGGVEKAPPFCLGFFCVFGRKRGRTGTRNAGVPTGGSPFARFLLRTCMPSPKGLWLWEAFLRGKKEPAGACGGTRFVLRSTGGESVAGWEERRYRAQGRVPKTEAEPVRTLLRFFSERMALPYAVARRMRVSVCPVPVSPVYAFIACSWSGNGHDTGTAEIRAFFVRPLEKISSSAPPKAPGWRESVGRRR